MYFNTITSCIILCILLSTKLPLVSSNFHFSENYEDILKIYIPTVNSKNTLCRNNSLFFEQEVKKFSTWAVQMFDSTTKFPTGFFDGSSYDFGNFDECIETKVNFENTNFIGKYCMAKFTLEPPTEDINNTIDTIWNKILEYQKDPSKNPRNVLRFAFCIPSTCSYLDLNDTLLEIVTKFNGEVNFTVNLEIDQHTCQVKQDFVLNAGDILFILIIATAVFNVVIGSLYHYLIQQEAFQNYIFTGKLNDILLCFSLQRNLMRIFTVSNNVDNLNCMAGMKVYSMIAIILLHRTMFDFGAAIQNPGYVEKLYSSFTATVLLNGPILVDTFFTISGFLASYLALNYYHQMSNKSNILQLYIHRYIRLTSTYWVTIVFYCTLFAKLGYGPLWRERIEIEQNKCRKTWWANLLYINNYYDTDNYCMFQSWYMACDMNAFMLVPILALLLFKKPSLGIISVFTLILSSMIAVFVTVYVHDEMPILMTYMRMVLHPNEDSTFLRVYIPGHLRAGAYFLGVLIGYLKYKKNLTDWKISRGTVTIGWIACVALLFFSLFIGFLFYVMKLPTWFSALYASLHRIGWSLGISWILIVVTFGYADTVNRVLSWKPLVILSRLTYTVYLCHGIIQMYSAGILRHPVDASIFNTVHRLAADLILAYVLAFILTILFESPIVGLEKILFKGTKNTSTKRDNKIESTELPTVS